MDGPSRKAALDVILDHTVLYSDRPKRCVSIGLPELGKRYKHGQCARIEDFHRLEYGTPLRPHRGENICLEEFFERTAGSLGGMGQRPLFPLSSPSSPIPVIRDRTLRPPSPRPAPGRSRPSSATSAFARGTPKVRGRRVAPLLDWPQSMDRPRLRARHALRRSLRPPRHDPYLASTMGQSTLQLLDPNFLDLL